MNEARWNRMQRSRYWKMTVTRGGCVMCQVDPPSEELKRTRALDLVVVDGHHIISKQELRNRGLLDDFEWDERNGMGVCRYHHFRHEHWKQRIPRVLLPTSVFEFAAEIDAGGRRKGEPPLECVLDREYPEAQAA